MTMEIAVYGKGGIGKSTVSANLSAALSMKGRRVLQIGCDPKHDSTRLLVHGKDQVTVLDYIREHGSGGGGAATWQSGLSASHEGKPALARQNGSPDAGGTASESGALEEILQIGAFGVGCVEAGGPKPGIGCAGRGIISAFEFLDRFRVRQNYDVVLYDVLGDVVCGGFAVPVRREYADVVYLVTSGEFMSLYAANNILRGIRNFDGSRYRRVAGILFNERRIPEENERVRRFAEAVHLPVCARIPRDGVFAQAEQRRMTLMEMPDNEEIKEIFRNLADTISGGMTLYEALPLSDEELERVVLGEAGPAADPEALSPAGEMAAGLQNDAGAAEELKNGARPAEELQTDAGQSADREIKTEAIPADVSGTVRASHRPPLYGCAFNGAASTAIHLTDACVIAHSPKACAFYTWQNISSPGRKNLFHRGILMPSAIDPNFVCSEMSHAEAVFGGLDRLRELVREKLDAGVRTVIVISSCVSGIIGDDIRELETMAGEGQKVIAVHADGVIAGDYMEGIRMALRRIGEELIDPSVEPSGRRVNLINETGVSVNKEENFRILEKMLRVMDITVHCRFLGDADTEQMRTLLAAPLNLLAADGEDSAHMRAWMERNWGCTFLDEALPVGAEATIRWARKVAAFFDDGDSSRAEALIAGEWDAYWAGIRRLRPVLAGRRIMITTINVNIDWLLRVIDDLQMELVTIGVMNYLHTELAVSAEPEKYPIEAEFPWENLEERIREAHPDILLSNYTPQIEAGGMVIDAIPMQPPIGFGAGIAVAERWTALLKNRTRGGWQDDRKYYEKYYA